MSNQFQPLVDSMEAGVKQIMTTLIDGTIEDLNGPILEVAQRMTFAARRGRMDLVASCRDQLAMLAMEKQLRTSAEADGVLDTILSVGINALISGAVGALASKRL